MLQVKVGQEFALSSPLGNVKAKVRSVEFHDYRGWPNDSGRIAVSIVVKNYSAEPNGVQVSLRCGESNQEGTWYADSTLHPLRLPPRTQDSGVLYVGMPKDTVDRRKHCTNPRLIVVPSTNYTFESGVRNFAARIKLPKALADDLY